MGLTPLLKTHSILPLLLLLNLRDSSFSSSNTKLGFFFCLKVEINQLFSLIIFLCELISNASDIDHWHRSAMLLKPWFSFMPKTIWKIRRRNFVLFCFFVLFFFFFFALIMFDMLVIVASPAYFGEFWPKLNEAIFLERKKELKKFVDMDYGRWSSSLQNFSQDYIWTTQKVKLIERSKF